MYNTLDKYSTCWCSVNQALNKVLVDIVVFIQAA